MICNYKKRCLFAGSFDPFHIGHLQVVKKALKKYKNIIICISNNENKKSSCMQVRYLQTMQFLRKNNINNVLVVLNFNLTIDIAKLLNCNLLVRSFLNFKDLKYELKLKKLNKPFKTKLFFCLKYKNIRSSLIRRQQNENLF